MRVSAIRLGKRKKAPDWGSAVIHEIVGGTLKEPKFKAAAEAIVANWENQPKFSVQVTLNAIIQGALTVGYIIGGAKLAKNIWNWLDKGTRRHTIRARNAPALVFPWGGPGSYKPKTKPGGKSLSFGGPGTVSNAETTYLTEVDHPGNEPRHFYVYLGDKLLPTWARVVRRAISRGMRNANKGKVYSPLRPDSKVVRVK